MKIATLALGQLRNEEHVQFGVEFSTLVNQQTATKLGIVAEFATHQKAFANENEALNVVVRSSVTDDLSDADALRDNSFSGLRDTVKGSTNHYKPEMRAAAARVQVLFDTNGNLAVRPYDEESAALTNLIADLRGSYATEVKTLGLADWITDLEAKNQAFIALKNTRYAEGASKTHLGMNASRLEVDAAYRAIVNKVNALVIVNGEAAYKTFILELNQRIAKHAAILAQRKGRKGNDDADNKTPAK